jgi:hypothetical protein
MFAPASIIIPASLIFSNSGWLVLILNFIIRFFMYGPASAFLALVTSLAAFCYWRFKVLRFILPILCFLLFIINPVGFASFYYALLWIIPLILAFFNNFQSFALGASFTAHAVGSVIWLYFFPELSAYTWLSLMPQVIIERILIASGIYCFACIYSYNINNKSFKLFKYIFQLVLKVIL